MKGPLDLAQMLLEKARHDLVAGQALLEVEDDILDTACFHAQQAAEKSLKAVLAALNVAYPLRHDLYELVLLVAPHIPELDDMAVELDAMTPYAVQGRYEEMVIPDADETATALDTAQRVYGLASATVAALQEQAHQADPSGQATPPSDSPADSCG